MPFEKDFCSGLALCRYCSDALGSMNWGNSTPLRKLERSDFGIHSVKCEQNETEQGSEKNKVFPVKVLFLEVSNYSHLLSTILVILDIVDICFLYSWRHVICFCTA